MSSTNSSPSSRCSRLLFRRSTGPSGWIRRYPKQLLLGGRRFRSLHGSDAVGRHKGQSFPEIGVDHAVPDFLPISVLAEILFGDIEYLFLAIGGQRL